MIGVRFVKLHWRSVVQLLRICLYKNEASSHCEMSACEAFVYKKIKTYSYMWRNVRKDDKRKIEPKRKTSTLKNGCVGAEDWRLLSILVSPIEWFTCVARSERYWERKWMSANVCLCLCICVCVVENFVIAEWEASSIHNCWLWPNRGNGCALPMACNDAKKATSNHAK